MYGAMNGYRAMTAERLSSAKIKAAKVAVGYRLLADGGNLYLKVNASGSKSWILRFKRDGRQRDMGLGSFPTIGLADARAKAAEQRKLLADDVDPVEERAQRRATEALKWRKLATLRKAAEQWLRSREPGWRGGAWASQWEAILARYVYPEIGELPVAAVDTTAIMSVVEPMWRSQTVTASRLLGVLARILDYATVAGYRQPGQNPAAWRGHLEHVLQAARKIAPVEHHAALSYGE